MKFQAFFAKDRRLGGEATSSHDRQGRDEAKLYSDVQIFPRNGRFGIAKAQEFLDEWASQVGTRGARFVFAMKGCCNESVATPRLADESAVGFVFALKCWLQ